MILITGILLVSCSKDKSVIPVKSFEVAVGDTLRADMGNFGDEQGMIIEQQAAYARLSRLTRTDGIKITYEFSAIEGYTGSDQVLLKRISFVNGVNGVTENVSFLKLQIEVK